MDQPLPCGAQPLIAVVAEAAVAEGEYVSTLIAHDAVLLELVQGANERRIVQCARRTEHVKPERPTDRRGDACHLACLDRQAPKARGNQGLDARGQRGLAASTQQ